MNHSPTIIQTEPERCPIFVVPRKGGGWRLSAGNINFYLTEEEVDALVAHFTTH